MVCRVLTYVTCTSYFIILCIIFITGLTALVIGIIGLGLYIPTADYFNEYNENSCMILAHQYDLCNQQSATNCYSAQWSVEYDILNESPDRYVFSTIKKKYETPEDALRQLDSYLDKNNYTCYYDKINVLDVKWDKPPSPTPYLIMVITGFVIAGINSIIIASVVIYRWRKK